jgi:hypothetical protein
MTDDFDQSEAAGELANDPQGLLCRTAFLANGIIDVDTILSGVCLPYSGD